MNKLTYYICVKRHKGLSQKGWIFSDRKKAEKFFYFHLGCNRMSYKLKICEKNLSSQEFPLNTMAIAYSRKFHYNLFRYNPKQDLCRTVLYKILF